MSGLEIVGVVAGIVSAITAVGGAIKKARRERRVRLQSATENLETRLITTLDNGPPRINGEYNSDVARLGSAFTRGDETANSQLVSILMNVTGSLVNVVNSFVAAGQFTFAASNYQSWNSVGSNATDNTIRTLAQLYHRKLPLSNLALPDSKFQEVKHVHWNLSAGGYYKGEALNGKRHGYGENHNVNGDVYKGNWVSDIKEGYGKYVWANGASYTGEWKAHDRHGHGLYIWENGASYNGEWSNGVMHGEGKYIGADGITNKGTWKNGLWD